MIKKLDLYLLKSFFTALLVVVLAIGLTIVVINMIEELQDFVDHKVPMLQILEYYLYFLGWVVKQFLPMFVLLATLFSVSMLARKREILAMKASGRSLYRIALPYLLAAVVIAIGHFCYNEYIFPSINHRRLEIKEFTIERHSKEAMAQVQNIYRQISPGYFYTIGAFNTTRSTGREMRVYRTTNNRLTQIITADRVSYKQFQWVLEQGMMRDFDTSSQKAHRLGEETSYRKFDTLTLADIKDTPEELAKKMGDPLDMGLDELKRYIDLMKRTGGPYVKQSVDLKLKYAFPMTSIIIILICVPFASNPRRSGIAVSFAMGAAIALLYFILFRILQSAGYSEKVPEYVAAWAINAVFLFIGIILMMGARK